MDRNDSPDVLYTHTSGLPVRPSGQMQDGEGTALPARQESYPTALSPLTAPGPAELVVAGVLSPHSRRAYLGDIRHFLSYLSERGIALPQVNRAVLIGYRAYLAHRYAPSTANRRLTVARRLVTEAWEMGLLEGQSRNPAEGRAVAGLKHGGDRGKPALTLQQARDLIASTRARGDLPDLRDTALLHLLIATGLRRSEVAAARLSDLRMHDGYNVLYVRGKGNKHRLVKLAPALLQDVYAWLVAAGRGSINAQGRFVPTDPKAPLFSRVRRVGRGDQARWKVDATPLSDWSVWYIVTRRIIEAGLDVDTSPHGLRATFITLALEGGATISRVQDAAGHSDPRTTDRYRRRKSSLDDNAADYIRL
jgi:site-specific recombinase XerD